MATANARGNSLNVKWDTFSLETATNFQLLREEEEFLDVTLVSGDGDQVQAHKLVLAAGSEFFRSILGRNPHPNPLIFLKGLQHQSLLFLLDFLYRGEVTIGEEQLASFLELGEVLRVKGLLSNKTETETGQVPDGEIVEDVYKEVSLVKSECEGELAKDLENNQNNRGCKKCEEGTKFNKFGFIVNPTSEQKTRVFNPYLRQITRTDKLMWECLGCRKTVDKYFNIQKHIESNHVKGFFLYRCHHCSELLYTYNSWVKHNGRVHTA